MGTIESPRGLKMQLHVKKHFTEACRFPCSYTVSLFLHGNTFTLYSLCACDLFFHQLTPWV